MPRVYKSAKDPERYGKIRRNRRDLPLLQRSVGKDAGDRMAEEVLTNLIRMNMFFLLLLITDNRGLLDEGDADQANDEDITDALLVMLMFCTHHYFDIQIPRINELDPIDRIEIRFSSLTGQDYDQIIGFSKMECWLLYQYLRIPEEFTFNQGTNYKFKIGGRHCFRYF
jgi:hypothetical protein